MKKLGYDDKKMPLGKLAPQAIKKGYEALNKINLELSKKKSNKNELQDLSSEFYTYIPHNIGFASDFLKMILFLFIKQKHCKFCN